MCIDGSGGPLEADAEAVRVLQVKLLHSVVSHFWWFNVNAVADEVLVGRVNIRAAKIQACIVMAEVADRVWHGWPLAFIVCGIQHELDAVAAQQAPVEEPFLVKRRLTDEFETK